MNLLFRPMASEQNGEAAGKMLGDMVKDADEYYAQLTRQHDTETRIHATVMGALTWFAAFVVLGAGAYFTAPKSMLIEYLLGAFLGGVAIGAAVGIITYLGRRKRGFKFAELGSLLARIKERGVSAEDGLRLMDAMHQAALIARKKRLDAAFEYGMAAFILVSVIGLNAGFGALAGVVTYLYFRFEALREYESEDERYEVSKKEILLSL